jgi:hypothetical protein
MGKTVQDLKTAATEIVNLLADQSRFRNSKGITERYALPIIWAYLHGRYGLIQAEHHVWHTNHIKPKRIDFRRGGNNPWVIEVAMRPEDGGAQLSGGQNIPELQKLCRVNDAKLRILFLLDLAAQAALSADDLQRLRDNYESCNPGPGNFARKSVRVIYANQYESHDFIWRAKRTL